MLFLPLFRSHHFLPFFSSHTFLPLYALVVYVHATLADACVSLEQLRVLPATCAAGLPRRPCGSIRGCCI